MKTITIRNHEQHTTVPDLIHAAFGSMIKVPRTLLTTNKPHEFACPYVPDGKVTFIKIGQGRSASIYGRVGSYTAKVF